MPKKVDNIQDNKKWGNPKIRYFFPFCKKFILSGWCHVYYNSRRENISFPSSRFRRKGALDSCSWRNCFKVGFQYFLLKSKNMILPLLFLKYLNFIWQLVVLQLSSRCQVTTFLKKTLIFEKKMRKGYLELEFWYYWLRSYATLWIMFFPFFKTIESICNTMVNNPDP